MVEEDPFLVEEAFPCQTEEDLFQVWVVPYLSEEDPFLAAVASPFLAEEDPY